ncbi:MAG: hypothetical protein ACP5UV_01280 [Thermoplasmata archaeon]
MRSRHIIIDYLTLLNLTYRFEILKRINNPSNFHRTTVRYSVLIILIYLKCKKDNEEESSYFSIVSQTCFV